MDYKSQTLLDLKTMCRDRGLKVSGTKDEVIIRLMENDEANQTPGATITPVQTGTVVQGATYTTQQMVNPAMYNRTFKVKEPVDGASNAIGVFLIIYGILRALWALFFTAIGAGAFIWNPVALVLAAGFVLGGSLMTRGYKNGIYISLVTLVISGVLSLIFHPNNWEDLTAISLPMIGDQMLLTSMMCSAIFIGIVALPLLLASVPLKEGYPERIQSIVDKFAGGSDVTITCPSCSANLAVPANYSGKVKCPSCGEKISV